MLYLCPYQIFWLFFIIIIINRFFSSLRSPSRGRFGWRKRGLEKSKSLDQSEFLATLAGIDINNLDKNTSEKSDPDASGAVGSRKKPPDWLDVNRLSCKRESDSDEGEPGI